MQLPASSLLKLTRFPLALCEFVFQQVRERALALDVPAVVALAEYGIARAKVAMEVDHDQRMQHPTQYPPETREVDQLVDAAVSGFNGFCESQIALFRGEERAAAAARLRNALLPRGVKDVTQLSYVEQHAQINALLARAQEPDLRADLTIVPELGVMLARIGELNTRYGDLLGQSMGMLTRQDVRAHHDEVQEILCTLACLIIGHFGTLPERHDVRDRLLDPILRQHEALRERRRRRRASRKAGDDAPDDLVAEPDDEV